VSLPQLLPPLAPASQQLPSALQALLLQVLQVCRTMLGWMLSQLLCSPVGHPPSANWWISCLCWPHAAAAPTAVQQPLHSTLLQGPLQDQQEQ
jgi:hypothetical protein